MNASTKTRKFALMGIVVALALAGLALVGCAGQQQPSSQGQSSSSSQAASSASSSESSSAPASPSPTAQGNVLVAYFSASGNTERVAQQIASDLGADTFAITPAEPYTSEDLNWNQEGSRVNIEHENESARDIELAQVTPDGWDGYDTVFIGYPIWWGIAAWPVDGFVSGNNFDGKTVIPFCTSTSSGLGQSADLLEQMANGGTWLEGMRFSGSASAADVSEWVNSLALS